MTLEQRAAAMLRRLQWADDVDWCPECSGYSYAGHEPDCALANMIDELETVEGTAAKVQRKEQEHA